MKLPFAILKTYSSELKKSELLEIINNGENEEYISGLTHIKFMCQIDEHRFYIRRYEEGFVTIPRNFPLIKCEILKENPLLITVRISPGYFQIIFFLIFGLIFLWSGIFSDQITINGVVKNPPELSDRLPIVLLGCVVPYTLCYLLIIRPVHKAKKWIENLLQLEEQKS